MKKPILTAIVVSFLIPLTVYSRGTISSGSDNSTAFACKSPGNVDASFDIVGFGNIFDRRIELEIYIDGNLVAKDIGILTEGPENFRGQTFDIDLKNANDISKGQIRAKLRNPILQVGQGSVLVCKRSRVH